MYFLVFDLQAKNIITLKIFIYILDKYYESRGSGVGSGGARGVRGKDNVSWNWMHTVKTNNQ